MKYLKALYYVTDMDIFNQADDKLKSILLALDTGQNILLHGSGGTGKTHSLRLIASYLVDQGKTVACTATTGIAALNLNIPEKYIMARTLHSWAGIGLGRLSKEKLYNKVYQKKIYRDRWRNTDVLIIDEISMFGKSLLEKIDYVGRRIRQGIRQKDPKPFGGIQLIFSGDFLQLPPVKDEWGFFASAWEKMNLVPFVFIEPKRYNDLRYFELLLRLRKGEHTEEDIKLLYKRVNAYDRMQEILENTESSTVIKPTILFSRRIDVHAYNSKELDKLPNPKEFVAIDEFTPFTKGTRRDSYISLLDDSTPKALTICVGAQVMLKANLDVQEGLVNGTRGVVTEIITDGEEPVICTKFLNGKSLRLTRHVWSIEDKDGCASRSQFPLILAWAFTIHRGQGSTLDYAIIDLGTSIFSAGQAYVALSRVRNLKGLFISDLYPKCIKADEDALEFEKNLCEVSFQVKTILEFDDEITEIKSKTGLIRVGKILYGKGSPKHPTFEGYSSIVVMTKSSKYGSLGPYVLKNSKGQIMENVYQFSKIYATVPKSKQPYSRYHTQIIIWEHPEEIHLGPDNKLLPEYWTWREKGFNCEYAVRYPVGKAHTKKCVFALKEKGGNRLNYIQARKEIYIPVYAELVKEQKQFAELQHRLGRGENLLIIEVDGPHQESLSYYEENYNVDKDFIENNTMIANLENLKIMLNDTKHAFGHGYCLAAVLLGIEEEFID